MPTQDIYNCIQVNDRLLTGGQPTEDQIRAAADEGYTAVINLATLQPERALADEAGLVRSLGMAYFHIPVQWDAPLPADFAAFEQVFQELLRADPGGTPNRVLLHCAANYRATAFFSLYAWRHLSWIAAQAEAFRARIWADSQYPVWQELIQTLSRQIAAEQVGPNAAKVIIRAAAPADAEGLVQFVQRIAAEPQSNLEMSAGEFTLTSAEESQVVTRYAQSENSLFLVAETGGSIIGLLTCGGGKRQSKRHCTTLGITVAKEYRGLGVGRLLMARAVEWAEATSILKRIELYVLVRNQQAIHLYEGFGFQVEGRRQNALFRDGAYLDDLLMARVW